MEKKISELLQIQQDQAQQTTPSNFDLPDILTDAEKRAVIENEVDRQKSHLVWRMLNKGLHKQDVEFRVSQIDFLAQLDQEKLLRDANQRKHWKQEEAELAEKRKAEAEDRRKELMQHWDANRFYNTIKQHFVAKNGQFITGEHNDRFIKTVCFFFSNDPRFETELGCSYGKGLLIQGSAGLGKTETIRAVSKNPLFPVKIHSILDISDTVQQTGECNLNTNRMLLIDDVGTEPEVINHYGTKIVWFKDFIETYYLHHTNYAGLIVTTNLSADEIEKRYGYRVRSRMREMFNLVSVTGTDLRK